MEIYTLVSLSIGIFGACYAALNAMRTHLDGSITQYYSRSEQKLAAVKDLGKEAWGAIYCSKHHWWTKLCRNIWIVAHFIPAGVFFLFMVFIGFWVNLCWEDVISKHDDLISQSELHLKAPWSYFRSAFFWMCVLDLVAILSAILAWFFCRHFSGRIGEIHNSITANSPVKDPSS